MRERRLGEEISAHRRAAAEAEGSRSALQGELEGARVELDKARQEIAWVTSTRVWRWRRDLLRRPLVASFYRTVARLLRRE